MTDRKTASQTLLEHEARFKSCMIGRLMDKDERRDELMRISAQAHRLGEEERERFMSAAVPFEEALALIRTANAASRLALRAGNALRLIQGDAP